MPHQSSTCPGPSLPVHQQASLTCGPPPPLKDRSTESSRASTAASSSPSRHPGVGGSGAAPPPPRVPLEAWIWPYHTNHINEPIIISTSTIAGGRGAGGGGGGETWRLTIIMYVFSYSYKPAVRVSIVTPPPCRHIGALVPEDPTSLGVQQPRHDKPSVRATPYVRMSIERYATLSARAMDQQALWGLTNE